MLILTRRRDEEIKIGEEIRIVVIGIEGNMVRIGIDAPKEIPVRRGEVCREPQHD